MGEIRVEHLCKAYGEKEVLRDLSAVFPLGVTTCIMAPSGGGKTTLLRILMGLERADSGKILGMPLHKSAVFQEDRLLEGRTVEGNVRLITPSVSEGEVRKAMQAVGLGGCFGQPVRELSGGMRRRAALLRALLAEYEILFLDEPFKGLDQETKETVISYTRESCRGKTVLFVTHEEDEAKKMEAGAVLFLQDMQNAAKREKAGKNN